MTTKPTRTEPTILTKPKSRDETQTRQLPPYHLILENDDYHSFAFVIEVLCKALGYATERASKLTLQAHTTGRAVVWSGPKEVAELKADQIRSFHEIRGSDGAHLGPLSCTIEPAAGA